MFSTSVDILNLVLAACIVILTFFLSVSLYYFLSSTKKVRSLIKHAERGVTKAEETVSLVKEKIKSSSAYVAILAEVAKQVMVFVKKKQGTSKSGAAKTKKKK